MINHISLAVNNPSHVAEVVAELWQGQAAPFPGHPGYYITFAMDSFGSLIEFLPKKTILQPNPVGKGVQFSDLSSVPVHTATHANLMVPISEAQIYAIAEREGWRAVRCKRSEALQELTKYLQFIEAGLQTMAAVGPYWLGSEVSLVDLTYYPWFEQWTVLAHYRGFQLPTRLDRLKQWCEAVAARDSVRAIAQSQIFYIERYAQFAQTAKVK